MLLCALTVLGACSGGDDEGGGGDGSGAPDAGVGGPDDPGPDAGLDPPTEQCAATCDGCCDGDACLSGTSPNACGSAGGACAVCDPGFVCELGGCTVDRTSRWDVLADSGEVFEDNAGGSSWDPSGGLPDPYVDMTTTDGIDDLAGSSSAQGDTLAPIWNQVVLGDVPASALVDNGLSTTVLDDDPVIDPSDSMGTCLISIGDADFTGDTVTFDCPFDQEAGARGWTLRLRLIRK
ncbi:MAG TPA: hypothetical protein VFU21_19075 [Kofleriaceae bacterium]|nr:hypothetical protein [Kofleriaceae bacterium]